MKNLYGKRILSVVLALACLFTMSSAFAYDKYDATISKAMEMKPAEMVSTASYQAIAAAIILLDYMIESNKSSDFFDEFDFTGTARIANRSNVSIDVYYPLKTGNYLNLYLGTGTWQITDYGKGSFYSSSEYTYYSLSMTNVLTAISATLEKLNEILNN